jgi:hypothetical protein
MGGQLQSLTVSDDIGDPLGALDTNNGGAARGSIMEKRDNTMHRNSRP